MACPCRGELLFCQKESSSQIFVKNRRNVLYYLGGRAGFPIFSALKFAPGNRIYWVCGESSANSGVRRAGFSKNPGPRFAHGNRKQWACGESSANCDGDRAALFLSSGPRFALGNRKQWLCGESSANCDGNRT